MIPPIFIVETKSIMWTLTESQLPGHIIGADPDDIWVFYLKYFPDEEANEVFAEIWVSWKDADESFFVCSVKSEYNSSNDDRPVTARILSATMANPGVMKRISRVLFAHRAKSETGEKA